MQMLNFIATTQKPSMAKYWFVALSLLGGLIATGIYISFFQVRLLAQKMHEEEIARTLFTTKKLVVQRKELLRKQLERYNSVSVEPSLPELIESIADAVPRALYLTNINIQEKQLALKGFSKNAKSLKDFLNALATVDGITNVQLARTGQETVDNIQLIQFYITLTIAH